MDYLSLTVIIQTQWNKNRKVAHSCQCVPALSLPHMHTHVLTQSHKGSKKLYFLFTDSAKY